MNTGGVCEMNLLAKDGLYVNDYPRSLTLYPISTKQPVPSPTNPPVDPPTPSGECEDSALEAMINRRGRYCSYIQNQGY